MKRIIQVAATACSLPLIQAGSFKWNGNRARDVGDNIPAYETGVGLNDIQMLAMGPEPTSPAQPKKERSGLFAERRNTDDLPASVCGYIEGSSAYPYACAVTDSCLFTTISGTWVGGCCPTTSLGCEIATTCIDSSVWATLTSIGDHTYSCTFSDYPYCLTMTYGDLVGYTIMNCAAVSQTGFELIDHEPVTVTSTSSVGVITSIITSAENGDGTSTNLVSATSTSTSSSSSATATSTTPPAAKSSLPTGAIAGGAVGGIAVIALLILGLVFILRRNKNGNDGAAPNSGPYPGPPPPGGYPTQPAMEQQWQQPPPAFQSGFGVVDNNNNNDSRASVQKPPYDVKTTSVYDPALSSSPGSPPPPPQHQSPSPGYPSTESPPVQQNQRISPTEPVFQGASARPNQGFEQQHQHGGGSYHEMPAGRADGELRELA